MKKAAGYAAKGLFILVLFAVFFSYAMFQGGFVSWFLFYGFLPIIIYMAALLLYPLSRWHVRRHISKPVLGASEEAEIEIVIDRKIPFPIYYCIIEEVLPDSLHRQDTNREKYRHMEDEELLMQRRVVREVVFPWFRKKIRCLYRLESMPRGEHQFHTIRVRCADFFGFIKKEHLFQVDNHLLVHPAKREIAVSEKASSFDEGTSAAYNMQAKSSNVVTGVREYMPGDRFSWIDWKTTARRNTVMTKEFEQEKSSSVLLLFDSAAYPGLNRLAYEGSIEVAASLAESLRKSDSSFAFLSLGDEKTFFPFQADPVKKRRIFHYLAKAKPGTGPPFSRIVSQELTKVPSGVTIMVVTTKLDMETKQSLDRMKRKSKHVVVFLVKPANAVSEEERNHLRQLQVSGAIVNVITEEKLLKQKFEVRI